MMDDFEIQRDFLEDDGVFLLLSEHLNDMNAHSPPENVFALRPHQLKQPNLLFWSAKYLGNTIGCIGLRVMDARNAEVKSMRVDAKYRGAGVAKKLLDEVLIFAEESKLTTLWLETGRAAFFTPAVSLYQRYGFIECECFGDYQQSEFSRFMKLELN